MARRRTNFTTALRRPCSPLLLPQTNHEAEWQLPIFARKIKNTLSLDIDVFILCQLCQQPHEK
jgi:hypothetical protein